MMNPKESPLFRCAHCSFKTNRGDSSHFKLKYKKRIGGPHPGLEPQFLDDCTENRDKILELSKICFPLLTSSDLPSQDSQGLEKAEDIILQLSKDSFFKNLVPQTKTKRKKYIRKASSSMKYLNSHESDEEGCSGVESSCWTAKSPTPELDQIAFVCVAAHLRDHQAYAFCRVCQANGTESQVQVKLYNMKMHAYYHLDFPLFQCTLCQQELNGAVNSVHHHFLKRHLEKLKERENYIIDRQTQYDSQMAEIFAICYDKSKKVDQETLDRFNPDCDSNKKIGRICKNRTLNIDLEAFKNPLGKPVNFKKTVSNFVIKYKSLNCVVTCQLCSKRLDLTKAGTEAHVYGHLKHALFSCNLCSYKGNNIKNHLRLHLNENEPLGFVDCRGNYEDDLISVFENCFPPETMEVGNLDVSAKGHSTSRVWRKFQKLIKVLCKLSKNRLLECKLCGKEKSCGTALNHVLWHLAKPLFFCDFCSYKGSLIFVHQRKIHKYEMQPSFQNFCHLYELEFKKTAYACFGQKSENNRMLERNPHEKFSTTHLKQLLQTNGFACCQICSDKKRYTCLKLAQQHAMWHFGRSLFTCKLCDYEGVYIKTHLNKEHGYYERKRKNRPESEKMRSLYVDNRIEICDKLETTVQSCFFQDSFKLDPGHDISAEESQLNFGEPEDDEMEPVNMLPAGSALDDQCFANLIEKELNNESNDDGDSSQQLEKYTKCLKFLVNSMKEGVGFVKCKLCQTALKISTSTFEQHVIAIHLPPEINLAQCGKCLLAFSDKNKLRKHVLQTHSSSTIRGYLVDLRFMYQKELLDLIKHCFMGAQKLEMGNSSAPDESLKPNWFLQFVSNLCNKLTAKRISIVCCSKCDKSIGVARKSFERHVMVHANVDSYSCNECQFKATSRLAISKHLKGAHNIARFTTSAVEDIRFLQDEKLLSIAKLCFENAQQGSRNKMPKMFLAEISKIERKKIEENEDTQSVLCNVCQQTIPFMRMSLICHVYGHCNKPMFKCLICNFEIVGKTYELHTRGRHPEASKVAVEDLRYKVDDDLRDMAKTCFGNLNEADLQFIPPIFSGLMGTFGMTGNTQTVQKANIRFTSLTSRIILSLKTAGKKSIACHDCQEEVAVRALHTHVYKHLKKPMYQCSHCKVKEFNTSSVTSHMRRSVACFGASVIDLREEHDEELVGCLRQCLGDIPVIECLPENEEDQGKRKRKRKQKISAGDVSEGVMNAISVVPIKYDELGDIKPETEDYPVVEVLEPESDQNVMLVNIMESESQAGEVQGCSGMKIEV